MEQYKVFSQTDKQDKSRLALFFRLPKFIEPDSYDIEIVANMKSLLIKGAAILNFKMKSKSDFIVFHSKNMTITSSPKINNGVGVKRMSDSNDQDQVSNF